MKATKFLRQSLHLLANGLLYLRRLTKHETVFSSTLKVGVHFVTCLIQAEPSPSIHLTVHDASRNCLDGKGSSFNFSPRLCFLQAKVLIATVLLIDRSRENAFWD